MTDTSEPARAELSRARLFEAATKVFAAKGFHGTTTRDIAAAAGMSPAALYVHHRSKEELLFLISRAGHEETLQLMRAAIESVDRPVEALHRLVYEFAASHARGHTRARIVNYELSALTPEHYREIRSIRREIERELREVVDRGVAAGEFRHPDPRLATVALLSLGIDISRWYREGGRWTAEQIAAGYADLALRLVGAAIPVEKPR